MGELLQKNVVDEGLREWILPNFSTSRPQDTVIASIVMMAAMQEYLSYKVHLRCGIPWVTLLGTKEDWETILLKLNRLDELQSAGAKAWRKQPTQFAAILRPIIKRFIMSFDNPKAQEIVEFWNKVCHYHSGGSGPSYYSGWVTAFYFWDQYGQSLYKKHGTGLPLDGQSYHKIESTCVPIIDDNGTQISAMMAAGSIGIRCTGGGSLNTMSAEPGWWIYEKKELTKEKEKELEGCSCPMEVMAEDQRKKSFSRTRSDTWSGRLSIGFRWGRGQGARRAILGGSSGS